VSFELKGGFKVTIEEPHCPSAIKDEEQFAAY